MRRLMILALTAALALSLAVVSQSVAKQGGLSPGQLNDHGWTCFNVPIGRPLRAAGAGVPSDSAARSAPLLLQHD